MTPELRPVSKMRFRSPSAFLVYQQRTGHSRASPAHCVLLKASASDASSRRSRRTSTSTSSQIAAPLRCMKSRLFGIQRREAEHGPKPWAMLSARVLSVPFSWCPLTTRSFVPGAPAAHVQLLLRRESGAAQQAAHGVQWYHAQSEQASTWRMYSLGPHAAVKMSSAGAGRGICHVGHELRRPRVPARSLRMPCQSLRRAQRGSRLGRHSPSSSATSAAAGRATARFAQIAVLIAASPPPP